MKKLILLTIAAVGFIACNSNEVETPEVSPMAHLEIWLDSIDGLGDVTAEEMANLEAKFEAATAGIDEATMDDSQKSDWEAITSRWEAFKANNTVEQEEEENTEETGEGDGDAGAADADNSDEPSSDEPAETTEME